MISLNWLSSFHYLILWSFTLDKHQDYFHKVSILTGFPGGSEIKNLPAMQEIHVRSQGREDPLEKGMATHSSITAWRIPWTEEAGGLQPIGSRRAEHDWSDQA